MDAAAGLVWSDPDTPALCLLALGMDRNPETEGKRLLCLNWTLDTWCEEIEAETGARPHPVCVARLGASLALLSNPDEFYSSVPGFSEICEGLAGDWFDTSTAHPLTTDEIVRAVTEAYLIDPPNEDQKFSSTVVRFVNMAVHNDGFLRLPSELKMFGIPSDPGVDWGPDLSGDPDLASMATAGAEDRTQELTESLKDYLLDLADRLDRLPLHRLKARPVAEQIRFHVSSEPAA